MALVDDATIANSATLLRVLRKGIGWTTTDKDGRYRPTSAAFFSTNQEISYFLEAPGILAQLQQIFPGCEIARIPASVIRGTGSVIERRPAECPPNFHGDHACHVVAGPNTATARNELEKRARTIAKHPAVAIIPAQPEPPQPEPAPP